jgi:hypothetical protein
MSLVLEALNRIERDRRARGAPEIAEILSAGSGAGERLRARRWPWALAGAILLLAGALFLARSQQEAASTAPTAAAVTTVFQPVAPVPQPTPVADATAQSTASAADDLPAIEGHVVVPDRPALSRLFIAGRSVRTGEMLDTRRRLLEVQPGIAVIDDGGIRRELPVP